MRLIAFLRGPNINDGVAEFRRTPGALLLDVRTAEEYARGHIPGSKNVPLQTLDKAEGLTDNKAVPIFVYCWSGARSRQAEELLRGMGHYNVKNLGGIASYTGKVAV